MKPIKKFIIVMISIIAFLYLIGEAEEISFITIILKGVSLMWLWVVAKANNYFYEERSSFKVIFRNNMSNTEQLVGKTSPKIKKYITKYQEK